VTHSSPARLAAAALLAFTFALVPGPAGAANARSQRTALPAPSASVKAKLLAYGTRCTAVGKRSQARVKGSEFAKCLDAMARLGSGRTSSPLVACRSLSAKAAKRRTQSPRARCMAAGAKVLRDRRRALAADPAGGGRANDEPADAGDDVSIEDGSGETTTPEDGSGDIPPEDPTADDGPLDPDDGT
jgi:hypothetical protein